MGIIAGAVIAITGAVGILTNKKWGDATFLIGLIILMASIFSQ